MGVDFSLNSEAQHAFVFLRELLLEKWLEFTFFRTYILIVFSRLWNQHPQESYDKQKDLQKTIKFIYIFCILINLQLSPVI
jgi:hypothetical protein